MFYLAILHILHSASRKLKFVKKKKDILMIYWETRDKNPQEIPTQIQRSVKYAQFLWMQGAQIQVSFFFLLVFLTKFLSLSMPQFHYLRNGKINTSFRFSVRIKSKNICRLLTPVTEHMINTWENFVIICTGPYI